MMIHCYMKSREVHRFSSYREALELSETPIVISIRKPMEDSTPLVPLEDSTQLTLSEGSTPLIQFLKEYVSPRPEIVIAGNLHRTSTIPFLINHFRIFRVVPGDISQSDLKEISLQAFEHHQTQSLSFEVLGSTKEEREKQIVTTRPPVTASPLDERRGEVPTRSLFDLPRPESYFPYVGGKRRGRQQSLSPKGRAVKTNFRIGKDGRARNDRE